MDFSDGGIGDDAPRKRRILRHLLDADAKPTQADRDCPRVMGKRDLLPMLRP